jgi:hypothetical protein
MVAKENIPWSGVLAYTRGQYVEADIVEQHGWQDYVVGENTKEGREIKADVSGRPVEDFEAEPKSSRAAVKTEKQEG